MLSIFLAYFRYQLQPDIYRNGKKYDTVSIDHSSFRVLPILECFSLISGYSHPQDPCYWSSARTSSGISRLLRPMADAFN